MGHRQRCLEVHDAHDSAATMSRGPWRSQLGDDDVQRSTTLATRWRSGLSSGPQARSSLKPLRRRWSTTATLPLWFRRTIPTMMGISLCLRFVLQDLTFFLFLLLLFFYCVCFGGFGLCFTVSVKFLFFFSSSTCACVWLLRKCGKEMGIWILVGVLKNLLKYGNVQYLLILIWTLCFQTLIEKFNFDSFFYLVFRYIIYFVLFFLILFILLKKKSLTYSKIWTNDNQVQNFTKLIN